MIDVNYMLDEGAYCPIKAHLEDAGWDIRTPTEFTLWSGCSATIDTGLHLEIPVGYVGFLKSKSGLNVRDSLSGEGVIDAGYTGSIVVKLYNHSANSKHFDAGDKIIQIVILPIPDVMMRKVDKFEKSARGDNGFGSSGK